MHKKTFLASAAALLLATSSVGMAADDASPNSSSGAMSGSGTSENRGATPGIAPNLNDTTKAPDLTPSAPLRSSMPFPMELKGKDLLGPDGQKIGDIEDVVADKLVVGVGGFLGIGERKVAISQDQITVVGAGPDAKAVSKLSKDELKALPEWIANR